MANKKNNAAKAAQVENITVKNEEERLAQLAKEDKAAAAKAEAERLAQLAKEAKAAAEAAKAEAKEAAKKAKAFSSRPVRKSYFEVRVVDNIQSVTLEGEFVAKSDVHYCAEKTAIDNLASLREQFGYDEHVYIINKVTKDEERRIFLGAVYLDKETNQIVID